MSETCQTCHGEGEILVCCDDMCVGQGYCNHGDGMHTCPECHGEGFEEDLVGDDYDDGDDFADDPLGRPGCFDPWSLQTCQVCGCTDSRACVVRGVPCHWVEEDLCSACAVMNKGELRRRLRAENRARKAHVRQLHRQGHRSPRRF